MIRVLVVDDSAYMRYVLRNNLEMDPDIKVVETARDGIDALAKIAALKPDVVTLDLEMPRMDGFTALKRIMADCPVPVIIISSLTQEGADATIRALRLGAVDFVPKPIEGILDIRSVREELSSKIKHVSGVSVSRLKMLSSTPTAKWNKVGSRYRDCHQVVVIGTSTGGPRALHEVMSRIPASLPAGVLIVQHMPPGFTRSLSLRLDEVSPLRVKEAEEGDIVQAGQALVAPGGYHMAVATTREIELNQKPPEHGVRPAVDVTMEAAARVYGPATIGVILTGMGRDGTRGAGLIRRAGGCVIAEDESTCVVHGMPRCAKEAGVVDKVVPLDQVAGEVAAAAERKQFTHSATSF